MVESGEMWAFFRFEYDLVWITDISSDTDRPSNNPFDGTSIDKCIRVSLKLSRASASGCRFLCS